MKLFSRRSFFLALSIVTVLAGCELIVDFDRTKIPAEDSGTQTPVDANRPDSPSDTGTPDTGTPDAAPDAAPDATPDAAPDALDASEGG